MKEENVILDESFAFSLRVLKLYVFLRKKKVEAGLCSQLLDSGTSIGANIEEAIGGSSRKDFINKMQIAYKEGREAKYWLRLLREGELIDKKLADSFIKDCEEILKILTAILNSSKSGPK
jgi:four helix bundle protein